MRKTLEGAGAPYWALICDDSEFCDGDDIVNEMICGVYSSKKEAQECEHDIKGCVCKHYIVKCSISITYIPPKV